MNTPRQFPRKGWWCSTCDVVTFEKAARTREDQHIQGWGPDGISGCPGRFQPVTLLRGHAASLLPRSS